MQPYKNLLVRIADLLGDATSVFPWRDLQAKITNNRYETLHDLTPFKHIRSCRKHRSGKPLMLNWSCMNEPWTLPFKETVTFSIIQR